MLNIQKILIEAFNKELRESYLETFGMLELENSHILSWFGRLALENISNSDLLYHDVEHTMMVSLVGQEILKGKHLSEGGVTADNWLHFMIALLCHDIGYVRGICKNDNGDECATGINDEIVEISRNGTDAVLAPYHIDRGKLFVQERFSKTSFTKIDVDRICDYIEMTRFPIPKGDSFYQDTVNYRGLVRASDLIGQLGDPQYLKKQPALFYEFSELGINEKFGYENPGDLRKGYPGFYWNIIRPYIQDALRYLRVTQEGKQWIANLHSHVFEVEHNQGMMHQ
ncbi:hypothetical protein OAF63_03840 [Saprospiraceae bacterium]|jgi:hypothetical protein|nr:hypothetical protein [Saprospiraceae bacterium]